MSAAASLASPAGQDRLAPVLAELAPLARRIDAEGIYPRQILADLGSAGAFTGASRPETLVETVEAMEQVAALCLPTGFCTWCQAALVWYLARTENAAVRRHLPALASGTRLGGTGLSNPMKSASGLEALALRGERVPGGYRVTGVLPWVSNLGEGHLFASVFALGDGRRVMTIFDCGAAGIRLVSGGRFIALEGTGTFSVRLRDVFVPDDDVLAADATDFLPRIRQGFVLLQMGMALGVALGAVRGMRDSGLGRAPIAAHVTPGMVEIETRLAALREETRRLAAGLDAAPDLAAWRQTLRLRREASFLALDATRSATLLAGAAGFREGSDVARRAREATFVAIVSPSVKHIGYELARTLQPQHGECGAGSEGSA
jgi:alkylation response protein AidB-like acyl-CoA dehydrogenase